MFKIHYLYVFCILGMEQEYHDALSCFFRDLFKNYERPDAQSNLMYRTAFDSHYLNKKEIRIIFILSN